VAHVEGGNCVALLQCGNADRQIRKWNRDPLGCLLATDPPDHLARFIRHGMHWNVFSELVYERSPPLTNRPRIRPVDAMDQFRQGHRRDRNLHLTDDLFHVFQKVFDGVSLAPQR
jgi:hypothetical protein